MSVAITVAAALILAGCDASPATPQPSAEKTDRVGVTPALTVTVAPVERGSVETTVSATGTVAAWQEVTVTAETSGLAIVDVLVEEGDGVGKGQLLARLNDALLSTQIAQQKAVLREAQATAEKADAANRRAQTLIGKNAVSKETAENAQADLDSADAQVAQAQAALDELNVQLSRTEIIAPVAGYVSERPVALGTVVQTGTELFHIVRDGRLEVAAEVPEQYLSEITPGLRADVTNAAGEVVKATVRSVAAAVDDDTRLGTVYIALPETSSLRPGMFARVTISVSSEIVLSIPQSALVWHGGDPKVFVLGDREIVAIRAVETGARSNGEVAITSGLVAGERIVTSGAGFLNDGNTVRVATTEADATASKQDKATQ